MATPSTQRTGDAPVTRITHLGLGNWRNFPRVDVGLARRTFLVGPNASGKSNFLDAIRFLHDLAAVGGGFEDAIGRRGGVSALRSLAARRYPDVSLHIALGTEADERAWEYEVSFAQDNRQRPYLKKETVREHGQTRLDRPDSEDKADPARLSQTFLEQVNVNREFRVVADFLRTVRYLHIVPQLVREPERSVGKTNDPYGGDFIEQIARTPERTRNARLRQILQALTIAVPQLEKLELDQDIRGAHHLRGKYVHWRPQGAWQSEADFSDGTLRLLGLLWALLERGGPLLLEEPELSLHPGVVRYVPQMLARMQSRAGRQVLVSTHSPELLQDDGIGLHEVLLLLPEDEGTTVTPASSISEVSSLLDGGLSIADIVVPRTRPSRAEQLSFFPGE
ncbi:MAG: AAA family ATPase [Solirubrobacteraceae bacterium]